MLSSQATVLESKQTIIVAGTMDNRPTGAYEIGSRCEGKSTKETEQPIKEREGDCYEHCERCTEQLASHQSYLFRVRGPFGKQSFRI